MRQPANPTPRIGNRALCEENQLEVTGAVQARQLADDPTSEPLELSTGAGYAEHAGFA